MRAVVLGWAVMAALPAIALADVTVRVLPPEPPKGFETEHITKAALPGHEQEGLQQSQYLETLAVCPL